MGWASFLCLRPTLIVIFWVGISYHFILVPLMLWNIAEFLLICDSYPRLILGTFSSFSLQPLSLLMWISLASLNSSGCISRVSGPAAVTIVPWLTSPMVPCTFYSDLTSGGVFWFPCCTFICISHVLFELSSFVKMLLGFITGRQGDSTTTCFTVCAWIE